MFKCYGCGSGLRYEPSLQKCKCDYCGMTYEPEELAEPEIQEGKVVFDSNQYSCPSCGAEVYSDEDTAATFCSFCGASVMLEGRAVKMIAPSYVLPFKIGKEQCKGAYRQFMKKALYVPSDMKTEEEVSKLRGIYIPYWNYKAEKNGIIGFVGRKSHRRGDYIITDHYDVQTEVTGAFDGIAYDASAAFLDEMSDAILPFHAKDNKPFHPAYLSGFYADTGDVAADTYESEVRSVVAEEIMAQVNKQNRDLSIDSNSMRGNTKADITGQLSYYPVWFYAARHKDRVSYVVINGQTGKLAADLPIDFKKYIIGSVIIAIPIMLLLNFMFTLTPSLLMLITIIFSIISMCTINNLWNQIYVREHNLNDKGLKASSKVKIDDETAEFAQADPATAAGVSAEADFTNAAGAGAEGAQADFANAEGVSVEATQGGARPVPKKKPKKHPVLSVILPILIFALAHSFFLGNLFTADTFSSEDSLKFSLFMFIAVNVGCLFASKAVVLLLNDERSGNKAKYFIKPVVSLVLGIVIMFLDPINDAVYYGGVLAGFVCVMISFNDLIKLHNQLAMRMPKQFGKRGGDEHAGI